MSEEPLGCGKPTGGPVGEPAATATAEPQSPEGEVSKMASVQVGRKAPDFEAPAYIDGAFNKIKLSDYLGHWVVLCFYPGDFTFV